MTLFSEGKQRSNGPGGAGKCRRRSRDWKEGCSWDALSERINEKKKGEEGREGRRKEKRKLLPVIPTFEK